MFYFGSLKQYYLWGGGVGGIQGTKGYITIQIVGTDGIIKL